MALGAPIKKQYAGLGAQPYKRTGLGTRAKGLRRSTKTKRKKA